MEIMQITHNEFQLIAGAVITLVFFAFVGVLSFFNHLKNK